MENLFLKKVSIVSFSLNSGVHLADVYVLNITVGSFSICQIVSEGLLKLFIWTQVQTIHSIHYRLLS